MTARLLAGVLLLATFATPAAAEFGPESADGFPVNVDGETVYPPVPPVLLDSPLNKVGPVTVYPYYPLLTAELQRLARDHPDLVKLTSAGKSTAGLDVWMLEIADFARIDAGEGLPLEGREVVYLDGGTHSNEYSGVYFVTEVAQFLLDEYGTNDTARWIVENRHVHVVPLVNPDGSNAFGRLNLKTVNINRNFPATWGAVDENPIVNNPGPAPESESETRVVTALLDRLRPDYVNSIHCCGNLWLHPWGAEDLPAPEDVAMYTRICDEVFAEVREDCGPIWSTIYPASGTTADEGYGRIGASSWTYEMSGRGRIGAGGRTVGWGLPAVANDVRVEERESWNGVLHALQNVHLYGARPKVVEVAGEPGFLDVLVENEGWGPLTAGTIRVGDASAPLPPLEPGARATVRVEGAFAPGDAAMEVEFVKRIRHAPTGTLDVPMRLVAEGGAFVGVLGEGDALAAAAQDAPVPATGLLGGLAAAALALRRRSA